MSEKPTVTGLSSEYPESMRAYVMAGGKLSHENGLELLDEIKRRRNSLIDECAVAAEQPDPTDREWVKDSISKAILKRAGDNVRRLKTSSAPNPK